MSIYSYLGMFPTAEKKLPKLSLLLTSLHCLGMIFFMIYVSIIALQKQTGQIVLIITSYGKFFSAFALNLLFFKEIFTHRVPWITFFDELEQLDAQLKRYKFQTEINMVFYYLEFALANVYCVAVFCFVIFSDESFYDHVVWMGYIYMCSVNIQIVGTTIIFNNLLSILAKRFRLLRTVMKRMTDPVKTTGNSFNNQTKTNYFLLINIVEKINMLFGQRILLLCLYIFLLVLNVFHYNIPQAHATPQDVLHKPFVLVYALVLLVSILK